MDSDDSESTIPMRCSSSPLDMTEPCVATPSRPETPDWVLEIKEEEIKDEELPKELKTVTQPVEDETSKESLPSVVFAAFPVAKAPATSSPQPPAPPPSPPGSSPAYAYSHEKLSHLFERCTVSIEFSKSDILYVSLEIASHRKFGDLLRLLPKCTCRVAMWGPDFLVDSFPLALYRQFLLKFTPSHFDIQFVQRYDEDTYFFVLRPAP